MSEELPTNISPERMAEIRSAVESAHQAMRQALALGTSPDLLKEALVKCMGLPEEQVEAMIKEHRDQLKREASVDRDLEVANMLTCLTLLYVPHPISWTVDGANHAASWRSSRCATAGVR